MESRPTQDTALRFFQHLLAEIEQLGPGSRSGRLQRRLPLLPQQVMPESRGPGDAEGHPTSPKEGKGDGKGGLCK